MKKLIHRTEKVKKLTDEELGECSADIYTVRLKILAGNLFWRISSFESNPPIFLPPKFHNMMSHHYCVTAVSLYNGPASDAPRLRRLSRRYMEFIIDSCVRRHHISKEFWTPKLGEELSYQHKEGNPNDVYAVAIKTDANIVVGHLPRKISAACSVSQP